MGYIIRQLMFLLIVGLAYSFISITINKWMAKKGFVRRPISTAGAIIFTYSMLVFAWILNSLQNILSYNFIIITALAILVSEISYHRGDLWDTFHKGRWWWLNETEKGKIDKS